jgi:3-oxoacyl-[acyl-carrier protein] reductase
MGDLNNKIIVITGGAQGIGAATAKLCAKRGATLVISDIDESPGESTVKEIEAGGGNARFVKTDVRDPAAVKALFDATVEAHGRVDAVVCAAGVLIAAAQTPEEMSVEDFMFTLDVNTKGTFLCAKYATPLLEKAQGVMVIIASPAGVTGPSGSLAYGASKGGVNGLAMTLAADLAPRNIRVNTICPGNISTKLKMGAELAKGARRGMTEEEVHQVAEQKYGSPDGVAKVIAFMLSDDAEYLRGSVFTR